MKRFRRFRRGEDGASSIEFVLLFPAFIIVLLSTIEAGILMLRYAMLERGVDIAVRSLRIGVNPPTTEDELKKAICNGAGILDDCMNAVRVELTRVDTATWSMPSTATTCVQRNQAIQPAVQFTNGLDHDLMLLRACAVFDPWFPSTGLGLRMGKDASGAYSLIATSAFVVEPT